MSVFVERWHKAERWPNSGPLKDDRSISKATNFPRKTLTTLEIPSALKMHSPLWLWLRFSKEPVHDKNLGYDVTILLESPPSPI